MRGVVRADGRLHDRVHAFRSLDDCLRLLGALGPARRAVVVGGGLLGLQTARALSVRGLATEVVEGGEHLLRSQVGPDAGRVLARDLHRLGTTVYTGARVVRLTDRRADGTSGARSPSTTAPPSTGSTWSCSRRGAGPRPRWPAARGSAWDAASWSTSGWPRSTTTGCTPSATAPSTTGAAPASSPRPGSRPRCWRAHLAGERVRYTGSRSVARLRATGLDVAVLGDPEHTPGQVVQVTNPVVGSHRKLVVRDGRIVAATLVGDLSRVGLITQYYDRGSVLGPAEPGALLMGDRPVAPASVPDDAEVCACAGVPAGAIRACHSLEQVRADTRATTGCGGCAPTVRQLLATRPALSGTP